MNLFLRKSLSRLITRCPVAQKYPKNLQIREHLEKVRSILKGAKQYQHPKQR